MTSTKQFKANLENSANAGVKTETGKAKVRHNAYKHGLTGKSILSGFKTIQESEAQFNELYESLQKSFAPQNSHEDSLIHLMASALWKMRRFDILDSSLWIEKGNDIDFLFQTKGKGTVLAISNSRNMELALKYKASMEAQYYRALSSLIQGRQMNQQLDLFLKLEDSCDET